jgi:hypothetical protein
MIDFGRVGVPEVLLLIVFVGGITMYFLPTIIAVTRKATNTTAILLVNALLGWTFIGWIVTLAWAVGVDVLARRWSPTAPSTVGASQVGERAARGTNVFAVLAVAALIAAVAIVVLIRIGGHSAFVRRERLPVLLDRGAAGITVTNHSSDQMESCSVELYGGYAVSVNEFKPRQSVHIPYKSFKGAGISLNPDDGYLRASRSTTMWCRDADGRRRSIVFVR